MGEFWGWVWAGWRGGGGLRCNESERGGEVERDVGLLSVMAKMM